MQGSADALSRLKTILREREAAYRRCDLTLQTSGRTVNDCVAHMLAAFASDQSVG